MALSDSEIGNLYKTVLGRDVDPVGLQVQKNAGLDTNTLTANLVNSDEFKQRASGMLTPKQLTTSPPPPPPPIAPIAAPAYTPQSESVSDRVNSITSQDSPLMATARASGERAAAARGLQNSSIAGQAAQQAVITAATPMASQEAAQAATENQSNQGFQQNRTLQSDSIQSQQALQDKDLAAAADRLKTQTQSSEKISTGQNANQLAISSNQNAAQERIANLQATTQTTIKNLDSASQERIAAMNVSSHDKQYAASTAASLEASYMQTFYGIANNNDIPAEARNQYLQHIAKLRDDNFHLIEQMYGVDLTWTSAATGADGAVTIATPGVTSPPPPPPPPPNENMNPA